MVLTVYGYNLFSRYMEDPFSFFRHYEKQTNTHNFDNVSDLIAHDALYWFSDGSFAGRENIRKAFEDTWKRIQNETYVIKNVQWIAMSDSIAACIYEFHWKGLIDGTEKEGNGRGTNVLKKNDGKWHVVHEHLSRNS